MAKTLQKKIKFSKGQVAPELVERTDLDFYDSSAQEMKNVISTVYGGVRSRYGTKYIDFLSGSASDEIEPTTITSDVCSDVSHFTDTEEVESDVLSTNKLVAEIDYGSNESGMGRIELRDIRVVPFTVEKDTYGTYSQQFKAGKYHIDIVGAGASGESSGGGHPYNAGGGSGAYVYGVKEITEGTYDIVVGKGGHAPIVSSGQDGGDSSVFGEIAGGGKNGNQSTTTGGAGGTATTTLKYINGNKGGGGNGWAAKGGESVYQGYGKGGSASGNAKDGGDGYAKIYIYEPSYTLIFSVSTDGVTWEELGRRDISVASYDVSIVTQYLYRYVKIEIDGDAELQSKIAFKNIKYFVSSSSSEDIPIKMHKFIYNNEERYLLVFMDETIQIYINDNLIQVVEATGLLGSYVKDAKVAYKDDTIIVTHPEMPPKQLQRQANGSWVWSTFTINNPPQALFGAEETTHMTTSITPSRAEGTVKITATSSIFSADYVGQYIDGNGGRVRVTEYVSGTKVNGITVVPFYSTDAITSWDYIHGYEDAWSEERGYPTTCLFAQQRLWFGGSKSLPSHIWASRLDDYNNFRNAGNYDVDSIDITMLTNNKIMNMIEQRGIHIFTSGDEWTIQEGTYTPDKISIIKNTNNGSTSVQPAILSGAVVFVEKNGKSLLSYIYNYDQASFTTENISLFSKLVNNPVSFDTEINSSKDKSDFVYLVLADGTMLTGCVLLDQKVMSITEYKTEGIIKDVCCVVDETYLIVDRSGTLCVEKIDSSKTDCTIHKMVSSNVIDGLYQYEDKYVYVYSDTKNYGKYEVMDNSIYLETIPNEVCNIGFAYDYYLESNPIAINGKTTSIKKRISKATLTCKNTKELEFNGQKKQSKNDIFDFYSCTKYGNDVRFIVRGEFSPVEILSVLLNINYEG